MGKHFCMKNHHGLIQRDPFVVINGMEWINHIAPGVRKHDDDDNNMAFGLSFFFPATQIGCQVGGKPVVRAPPLADAGSFIIYL